MYLHFVARLLGIINVCVLTNHASQITPITHTTESESKAELDRFIDAMISIREEIREIETGKAPRCDCLLTTAVLTQPDTCCHLPASCQR